MKIHRDRLRKIYKVRIKLRERQIEVRKKR